MTNAKQQWWIGLARLFGVFLLVAGMLLRAALPVAAGSLPALPRASVAAPVVDDDDDCDDDDDECVDDDDDDDEWEGLIEALPSTLEGTWLLQIGAGTQLTVTTTSLTEFSPPVLDAYAEGTWVEVDGTLQPDGTVLATVFRIDDFEAGEVVVRFADPAISATLAISYELELKSALLASANIYLFDSDDDDEPDLAEQIAAEPGVIWAEPNYVYSVPEGEGYKTWGWGGAVEPGEYTTQDAYRQIGLTAPARRFDGAGVTVAILDTGVYTAHEKLQGRLHLPALDVIDDDLDPSERGPGLAWGHGTHVAGIVAAMAPGAKILPVRVLDGNGRGNSFLLAYAIEWAVANGAQVINLSLGTTANSTILAEAVEQALAQGVVVVSAAGNRATGTVGYPAAYPGVLGVTAVDGANRKAAFANYGEGWVDLAAPGVAIMSTMIEAQGPGYATWSGTSMATGFVSGAAAQLLGQTMAQLQSGNGVAARLTAAGTSIDSLNPDYAGALGRLLNVARALDVEDVWMPSIWLPTVQR